jgi:hypothetical protein
MNQPERRCATCDTPLPPGSRSTRRFCSTSCRVRDWDRRNRPQPPNPRVAQLYASTNPKHYHLRGGMRMLVGHRDNEPWFGAACPSECPGLGDGEEYEPAEEYWRRGGGSG